MLMSSVSPTRHRNPNYSLVRRERKKKSRKKVKEKKKNANVREGKEREKDKGRYRQGMLRMGPSLSSRCSLAISFSRPLAPLTREKKQKKKKRGKKK